MEGSILLVGRPLMFIASGQLFFLILPRYFFEHWFKIKKGMHQELHEETVDLPVKWIVKRKFLISIFPFFVLFFNVDSSDFIVEPRRYLKKSSIGKVFFASVVTMATGSSSIDYQQLV